MDGRAAPPLRPSWIHRIWGRGGLRLLAGDSAVVLALFLAALLLFSGIRAARVPPDAYAVLVAGEEVLSVERGHEGVLEVAGPLGATRMEFRGGQVRVLSSPCPLKICQRAGWIGRSGEMIVCLPNRVVIKAGGRVRNDLDAVSR